MSEDVPSYYEAVTKPKRKQAQLLACTRGAPDGARTVDGYAYWVKVLNNAAVLLHLRRWTHQGKCKRTVHSVEMGEPFPIAGYEFHWPSLTMHTTGSELPPEDRWAELRQRALTPFLGEDVELPTTLTGGDVVEANKRLYHKRQAAKLLRLMPGDYTLLPGNKHIAYRLEHKDDVIDVHTLAPKSDKDELKSGVYRLLGGVLIKGQHYKLSPCGTKLYRAGHTEDLFGAQDDAIEQTLVFEEMRPKDKPVLSPLLVWYEVEPGATPKVAFHFYQGRNEKVQRRMIVAGKVSYRDNTYQVSPYGSLKLLQDENKIVV